MDEEFYNDIEDSLEQSPALGIKSRQGFLKSTAKSSKKSTTHRQFYSRKQDAYFELGGLGANIGTDDWLVKRDMLDKRRAYASAVQRVNTKIIKTKVRLEPLKAYTLKDKALDFAKAIPKPVAKRQVEPPSPKYENSKIAEFEIRHQELKKSVDEIRKQYFYYLEKS